MNKKRKPQKRGEFVPVGDMAGVVELPSGRVLSPCAATPQAQHHFTTLHQVNQLIEASEADADLGFMARLLALCSLPRTNPGDQKEYIRRNGPYALVMSAGGLNKLPFGNLPRLLLAWVCTEAVRTQNRELVLGRSLYEFMRKLGMERSEWRRANAERTRLREPNAIGCSSAQVSRSIYEDEEREVAGEFTHRGSRGLLVERKAAQPRPCCGTAQSGSGKSSSTRSSGTLCRSTCTSSRR